MVPSFGQSTATRQVLNQSRLNLTLVLVTQLTAPKVRDQSIVENLLSLIPGP